MKIYYLLSLSLFLTFISCSKDDATIPDQLSGTVDNSAFEVGQSTYSQLGSTDIEFNIYSDKFITDDPCVEIPEGVRLFFRAKNSLEKQELFLDLSSFEAFTVTISNGSQFQNNIATEGFFRIIEIKDDLITGNLDIKAANDTALKGEFKASLCN